MQTLDGWLIKFEDIFIKKGFPFFWAISCAFTIIFYKKNANRSKKNVLLKNSKWVSRNAEFHADFESIEKVLKKCTQKIISKNVTEICTFFTFTPVRQTCFAYNFFLCILLQLFKRIWNKSAWNSVFFDIFLILKKMWVILTFF